MVVRSAFRTSRAGIVIHAWIDTLRVLALLIGWAVAVAATANNMATFVWVSAISAAASTFSLISSHIALTVLAARIFDEARVHAYTVDARLAHIAFSVRATSNSPTSGLGITLVSRFTTAYGSVVLDVAFGVQPAIAWISALAVNASLRCWTLRVALATRITLQDNLFALAVDVRHR